MPPSSPSGRTHYTGCGRLRRVAALCTLLTFASATVAHAESEEHAFKTAKSADDEAVELARRVYGEGVAAYEQRRYEEAIELFKRAERLSPNPAFSFNIGAAYQNLANTELALRYFRDYLRQVPGAPDRAEVLARIRQLESRLAERGVQQVTIWTQPPNAAITIDGKAVGLSPWTGELPPGQHDVVVRLAGHHTMQRAFELPADRAIDIPITLLETPEALPAPEASPPNQKIEVQHVPWHEDVRPVTWGVLGVGVVSLGVSLVYELRRASAQDDVSSAESAEEREGLRDTAESRRTWADAFLLLGLGMTATSGVLVYADVTEARQRRKAAGGGLAFGCGLTACSVRYGAAF